MIRMLALLAAYNFYFENAHFMLDGKQFQMLGGEMHPSRIPYQYWEHRILMAKSMGLNTISIYVFWNEHEKQDLSFDFSTPQNNIAEFIRLCGVHDMFVIVRPGPFVCAEFDFGGQPSRFLKSETVDVRTSYNPEYVTGYRAYLAALAESLSGLMFYNDGPILMFAIENEYTLWKEQDRAYLEDIKKVLQKNGISGPFFTSDNAPYLNNITHQPGDALGLNADPVTDYEFELARKLDSTVPVFITEVYPGWFAHWNESAGWHPTNIVANVQYYVANKTSFVLYVVHGGTSFGLNAGSNWIGNTISPDLTSYDYGSPISEAGLPSYNYFEYRKALEQAYDEPLPDIPDKIPTMQIPNIEFERVGSIFDESFITEEPTIRPLHFEYFGENQGIGIYTAQLPIGAAGTLEFENAHDYIEIYLNGEHITSFSRTTKNSFSFKLPVVEAPGKLEVLCEAFGHINVDVQMLTDWKGIFDRVKFNGELVSYWTLHRLPLEDFGLHIVEEDSERARKGGIFKAQVEVDEPKDVYLDFTNYQKGYIFVNGHNLGRYWSIGPQYRLFCPGVWLHKGTNTIYVMDLEENDAKEMTAFELYQGCPDGQVLLNGYCE